jgi:CBS domain-containing protein
VGALSYCRTFGAQLLSPVKVPRLEDNEMNAAAILKFKARGVVATTADKSLLDIANLLSQHGIGCIVIMGDDDKIAGIVSERDLMRAISQGGPEVLKEPVSDFMTKTVVTAGEADTINQLMSEMTTHRFRHLPVVKMGRLIGIVSIGDLVKMHVADAEFESGAMRQYISANPAPDRACRLRLQAGSA